MSETRSSVLVLNSSRFGQGNPRLGESLMEDFLKTCAASINRPDVVLLYNSAVVLACKESKVLDSLKALENSGAKVLVNQESLVFYSLAASQEAGEEASIEAMSEYMLGASLIIKP